MVLRCSSQFELSRIGRNYESQLQISPGPWHILKSYLCHPWSLNKVSRLMLLFEFHDELVELFFGTNNLRKLTVPGIKGGGCLHGVVTMLVTTKLNAKGEANKAREVLYWEERGLYIGCDEREERIEINELESWRVAQDIDLAGVLDPKPHRWILGSCQA